MLTEKRTRWLLIGTSFAAISAWTLIRFFDRPLNFDIVGQQILAHQWSHGIHSGATVGPTNYILKMLLLYIPAEWLHLSAWTRLIGLTLLINIATLILIAWLITKILRFFLIKAEDFVPHSVLYIASISGSIFWISYANSRNLEVAGGLGIAYLCLLLSRQASWKLMAGLIGLSTLVFFADPLQVYMSLLPALAWVLYDWFVSGRGRKKFINLVRIFSLSLVGLLLARMLTHAASHIWNVAIASPVRPAGLPPLAQIPSYAVSTTKQFARLYSGGRELGHIVEAVNLIFVLAIILTAFYLAYKNAKIRPLVIFVGLFWVIDMTVFIASSQASQPDTNRYLIMTMPGFALATSLVLMKIRKTSIAFLTVAGVVLANIIALSVATVSNWDHAFSKDQHYVSAYSYLKSRNYRYGYAGMNTAMAGYYLSDYGQLLLPLGCQPDATLRQADLFFDSAEFSNARAAKTQTVPVIFDGPSITNNPSICTTENLKRQIGAPDHTDRLSDGSQVLIYNSSQLQPLKR